MGGDWNCTYSCLPVDTNVDVRCMAELPNIRHSLLLKKMCSEMDLTDPFRLLYPNRSEFSYSPRATGKKNRSRLDFFIISQSIAVDVSECAISNSLQNKLFDHAAISLILNKNKS